jgi:hypothetical protein
LALRVRAVRTLSGLFFSCRLLWVGLKVCPAVGEISALFLFAKTRLTAAVEDDFACNSWQIFGRFACIRWVFPLP